MNVRTVKNSRQRKTYKKKQQGSKGKYNTKYIRIKEALSSSMVNTSGKTKKNKKIKKQKGGSHIVTECPEGTVYTPSKCCLPGVKCVAPCYKPDFKNDSYPCVDNVGKSRIDEIMKSMRCKRGIYNPNTCCDENDVGTQCAAPCQDGSNCLDINGSIPMKKIMKRERAKELMRKLKEINKKQQEVQDGGRNLYNKISNPDTGRMVNINGIIGRKILANYLNLLN